jgi:hypothetical protein
VLTTYAVAIHPFEVDLTIVGVKICHDYKCGCDNPVQICMGLSQPSKSLYGVIINQHKFL